MVSGVWSLWRDYKFWRKSLQEIFIKRFHFILITFHKSSRSNSFIFEYSRWCWDDQTLWGGISEINLPPPGLQQFYSSEPQHLGSSTVQSTEMRWGDTIALSSASSWLWHYIVYYTGSTILGLLCLVYYTVSSRHCLLGRILRPHLTLFILICHWLIPRPEPAGVVLTWGLLNVSSGKLESGHYEFQWLGLKGKFSILSSHCAARLVEMWSSVMTAGKDQKLYYRSKILVPVYSGPAPLILSSCRVN